MPITKVKAKWSSGNLIFTDTNGNELIEFENDGTFKLSNSAVTWEDLRFPATAINPPGIVGDPDYDTTNIGWLFDSGGTEVIFIVAQLPHSYKEGTDLYAHVHWEPTNVNTGNVLWRLSYRWRNNGETAGAFTDVDLLAAGGGTANKLQLDTFSALSKSNALISSILDIKLSRIGGDASDTYNADARLKEFDIHYQIDTIGSRSIFAK